MTDPAMWSFVAAITAAIGICAYLATRRKSGLTIVFVSKDNVRFSGGVPQSKQHEIARFLTEDIGLTERTTIRGQRASTGWRISVSGNLPSGDQQRIRNFLLATL